MANHQFPAPCPRATDSRGFKPSSGGFVRRPSGNRGIFLRLNPGVANAERCSRVSL